MKKKNVYQKDDVLPRLKSRGLKRHSSFGCSRCNHTLKGVVFVKHLDIKGLLQKLNLHAKQGRYPSRFLRKRIMCSAMLNTLQSMCLKRKKERVIGN